uniref:Three-finger toxin n=1 Tax=Calliophis bivirgatus TaxID=8633 RepID=A0A898IN79_CALBG|nr:three-finger toxin [Calliophis bivirgatus]
MKTLLLTLVVVTIVCLDLGYTLQCYQGTDLKTVVTCPNQHQQCFKLTSTFPPKTMRGCGFLCLSRATCCSTDLCNA